MPKTLTLDIGNSRLKAATFCGNEMLEAWTGDVEDLRRRLEREHFDACAVSLVGSEPEGLWKLLDGGCEKVLRVNGDTPAILRNDYDYPAKLGADRWAAAVGAWKLYPNKTLLVVDAGTCITCDIISSDGVFRGGVIAPGVGMRLQAMHSFTSGLPVVLPTETPVKMDFPARNTTNAMRQGAYLGTQLEIEGYVRLLIEQYKNLHVCLTGGTELTLAKDLGAEVSIDRHLVHIGLNEIISKYEK